VLDVLPDPLVGVELWGVGGQHEQPQPALGGGDECGDGLGAVRGVAVDDQLDRPVGVVDQLLAELNPGGGEPAGEGGKPQQTLGGDRGDHVQAAPVRRWP
jgi:hypothetical protein